MEILTTNNLYRLNAFNRFNLVSPNKKRPKTMVKRKQLGMTGPASEKYEEVDVAMAAIIALAESQSNKDDTSMLMDTKTLQLQQIGQPKNLLPYVGNKSLNPLSCANPTNVIDESLWREAISRGDIFSFKTYLQTGMDINQKDRRGNTPLMIAIANNKLEFVKFLVSEGADINIITPCRGDGCGGPIECPLTAAFLYPPILEFLLESGADLNVKLPKRQTLLHRAVTSGFNEANVVAVIRLLVKAGVNINAQDLYGCTPMHYYCRPDSITIALLDSGADMHIIDENGWKPLHLAYKQRDIDLLKAFIKRGGTVHEFTPEGSTALHYACGFLSKPDCLNLVKFLIEDQKMDVNEPGKWHNGQTGAPNAFMTAVQGQRALDENFEILDYLIEKGANLNAKVFYHNGQRTKILYDSVVEWAENVAKIPRYVSEWLRHQCAKKTENL